jgi:hypothetical protein
LYKTKSRAGGVDWIFEDSKRLNTGTGRIEYPSSGLNDDVTNYIYLWGQPSKNKYWRYDITTGVCTMYTAAHMGWGLKMNLYTSNQIVVTQNTISNLPIFDKTTGSILKDTTISYIASGGNLNNLNSANYYQLSLAQSSIYDINLQTSTSVAAAYNHPSLALTNPLEANPINFHTFDYLGVILTSSSTSTLGLIIKSNFSIYIPSNSMNFGFTIKKNSVVGSLFITNYAYFAGVDDSNNVRVFTIDFDPCSYRSSTTRICSYCLTGYYLNITNLADNICLEPFEFPAGYGVRMAYSAMQPCASIGCIDCAYQYNICRRCSSGYYLHQVDYRCYVPTGIPSPIYGADASTGYTHICASVGCVNCKYDYAVCTQCDTSSYYYLNTTSNVCLHRAAIPDYNGADTGAGIINSCIIAHCRVCQNNYASCMRCEESLDYFWRAASSECVHRSNILQGEGVNAALGTILTCNQSTECQHCEASYTFCTACNTGFALDPAEGMCYILTELPSGKGATPTMQVASCTLPGCEDCRADYQVCLRCNYDAGWYILQANPLSCGDASLLPIGVGMSTLDGSIGACNVQTCTDCRRNLMECRGCCSGYKLISGNQCEYVKESLIIVQIPNSGAYLADFVGMITIPHPVTIVNSKEIYDYLKNTLQLHITIAGKDGTIYYNANPVISLSVTSDGIVLQVKFEDNFAPTQTDNEINISCDEVPLFMINGTPVGYYGFSSNFDYKAPVLKAQIISAEQKGDFVQSLVSVSEPSGTLFTTTIFTLALLDPSGLIVRLCQILKIISKLYFININYGKRLEAFLSKTGTILPSARSTNRDQVYHTNSYEGKLVMYYAQKVHLIIFNLVFIDFIWLATRTVLHSRSLPFEEVALAWTLPSLLSLLMWLRFQKYLHEISLD